MRRLTYLLLMLGMLAGMTFSFRGNVGVLAQAPSQPAPPRVLRIYREEVKPGMTDAHNKLETGWPRAFARANSTDYYIAMTSLTGPNEAWFVEPMQSFETVETRLREQEKNQALTAELDKLGTSDGAYLSGSRGILALYNEELSRPGPDSFALNRYVLVTTYRVRPGKNPDFNAFRALIKSVNETEKTSTHFVIYNVTSGAPTGTFLLFRGLKSMKELDPAPNSRTFAQLLGPANQSKLNELAASFMISSESALFRFRPEMSYPPKEFLTIDGAFWGAKTAGASVTKVTKKEAKKAAGGQ